MENNSFNMFASKTFRIILVVFIVLMISGISALVIVLNRDDLVMTPKQVLEQYLEALREQDIYKVAASVYPVGSSEYNNFIEKNKDTFFPLAGPVGEIRAFKMYNSVSKQYQYANVTLLMKGDGGSEATAQVSPVFVKRKGRWYLSADAVNTSMGGPLGVSGSAPYNGGGNNNPSPAPDTVPLRLTEAQKAEYSTKTGKHLSHKVNSSEHVDFETFQGCTYLNEVILPSNSNFHPSWFNDCNNLVSIRFDGVSPYYASIDGVVYTKNLTALLYFPQGKGSVQGSENGKFTNMPNTLTRIGSYAFANYRGQVKEFVLPGSLREIEDSAFERAFDTAEYKVILNEGLVSIGKKAFCDTKIPSISLPSTVKQIGNEAFKNMENLSTVEFPENSALNKIGYGAFENAKNLGQIIIPRGVTVIEDWTFDGCTGIYDVVLHENIVSIGMYAFRNCYNLRDLYISSKTVYIGKGAFQAAQKIKLYVDAPAAKPEWHSSWDLGLFTDPIWDTKFPAI